MWLRLFSPRLAGTHFDAVAPQDNRCHGEQGCANDPNHATLVTSMMYSHLKASFLAWLRIRAQAKDRPPAWRKGRRSR